MNDNEIRFSDSFGEMQRQISQNAINHGFYEDESKRYFTCGNDGELVQVDLSKTFQSVRIALQHSELSEGLEALRTAGDNPKPDQHCPEFSNLEIEMADAVIRIMDMSEFYKLRLAAAIIAKHNFNVGRPMKHGKKF